MAKAKTKKKPVKRTKKKKPVENDIDYAGNARRAAKKRVEEPCPKCEEPIRKKKTYKKIYDLGACGCTDWYRMLGGHWFVGEPGIKKKKRRKAG